MTPPSKPGTPAPEDAWGSQVEALGRFIHAQRKLAKLSLRELAALSDLSNAYLSQLERGLHQPSIRVLSSLAPALGLSPEELLREAGLLDDNAPPPQEDQPATSVEAAIRDDPGLTPAQKQALLGVYRSFGPDTPAFG
jgi:transcriptional regulator with XRE-family HTH domain